MFKYQKLADLLKKLVHTKCQLKDLIYSYSEKDPQFNTAVAYSNLSLILNNYDQFELSLARLKKKEKKTKITNKFLLFVLIAEQLNVGSIKGGGQLKRIITQNTDVLPEIQIHSKLNKSAVQVRVLRLKKPDETAKWLSIFESFQKTPLINNMFHLPYEKYSEIVGHHPQLRVSPACIVQSWSSALPPVLLWSELKSRKKFDVIDACSAPGNKTLQLGEALGKRGTVFAFEKNERRFSILSRNIEKHMGKNIKPVLQSFLDADPMGQELKKVRLILLDPSCSGSGMLTNFTRDSPQERQLCEEMPFEQFAQSRFERLSEEERKRVLSLQKFQLELLEHASKFNPLRISYSTCSIYPQENEEVAGQFLAKNPQYRIKKCIAEQIPGLQAGFGKLFRNCVRVDPRSRKSDGFFVCVFARRKPPA